MKLVDINRMFTPHPSDDTGTVTFLKIDGQLYALTAWHIPQGFKRTANAAGEMETSFYVPSEKGAYLPAPFVRVPQGFIGAQKDIGIMPIDARVLDNTGKEAFLVDDRRPPPFPLTHAVAVGFPTAQKRDITTERGKQLGTQCVHAIAEGITRHDDADQVRFHSDIEAVPTITSLSGMSGGPIFWTTAEEFGLLGITVEALDVTPIEGLDNIYGGPRVNFICDRTSHEDLVQWADYADEQWPKERERLNDEAERRQAAQHDDDQVRDLTEGPWRPAD
jgi:hypothetical protein